VNRFRILLPAAGVVAASVGGAAAWLLVSADHAVAVTVPKVSAQTAGICATLARHLPATVDGQHRDRTSPESDLVAAWGSNPIVLTCGVGAPAELTPGSPTYDPEAQAVWISGVSWLPVQESDGYAFYAIQREVYVEVFVPSSYNLADGNPGTDAPTDLSPAVLAGTPTNEGKSGPDVSPD
jgi:hypothetical protein